MFYAFLKYMMFILYPFTFAIIAMSFMLKFVKLFHMYHIPLSQDAGNPYAAF